MTLSPEVIAVVAGLIAPFIVQGLKLAGLGRDGGNAARWVAFLISVGLAVLYGGVTGQLPHLPVLTGADPLATTGLLLTFAGQFLAVLVLAFKTATLFYDAILDKVFNK